MITYGRLRSALEVVPARMSGNTGSMHGESEVMTPATNAAPRRINTVEEYESRGYEGVNSGRGRR